MAGDVFTSNTPPEPPSAGLNQTTPSGSSRPEREASLYSIPIQEEPITLADIWCSSAPLVNRLTPDQHQHSHLNNQAGTDLLQMDQWDHRQTETVQRLSGAGGPSRDVLEWNSDERARVPRGIRSGASNHHRFALDEVLPRDTAVYMISLYFDYVRAPDVDIPPRLTQYRSTL
jgi:hypothetical protein